MWGTSARADRIEDAAPTLAATVAVVAAVVDAAVVHDIVAVRDDAGIAAVPSVAPLTRRSRRVFTPDSAAPVLEPAQPEDIEPAQAETETFELLEPVATEAPAADGVGEAEAAASASSSEGANTDEADAFEAAARLFSFTGELPVQAAAAPITDEPIEEKHTVVRGRRAARGASFKRVTAATFSAGVIGIVGLLTVGLTTPADAVAMATSNGTETTSLVASAAAGDVAASKGEIQAYVTPSDVQSATIDRPESYSTVSMAQIASDSGILHFSDFFVNDPNGAIQWPFVVGVPISYGFGMRDGTMHEGVDFTPGEGAPIQAIADGVVRESTDAGGGYGVSIIIDHVIDGKLVSSHYAHMLYGSRKVEVGDTVKVGTVIGNTGNTGHSFGAHTHFEILMNGTTPIDPVQWLREHAGG